MVSDKRVPKLIYLEEKIGQKSLKSCNSMFWIENLARLHVLIWYSTCIQFQQIKVVLHSMDTRRKAALQPLIRVQAWIRLYWRLFQKRIKIQAWIRVFDKFCFRNDLLMSNKHWVTMPNKPLLVISILPWHFPCKEGHKE